MQHSGDCPAGVGPMPCCCGAAIHKAGPDHFLPDVLPAPRIDPYLARALDPARPFPTQKGWVGFAEHTHACNCIGPQNGQPKCPCAMRGVIQRDGRWIEPERDLGPVR